MEPINVLSLFDGMGCGRIALERLGIPIKYYFASEINKHAIGVTRIKFPQNIHKGSVTDVSTYDLPKIDLLLGGSPCQGFSFAGKGLNFDDPRSSLFFEYVRILKECRIVNPNVLYLLENVRMKKEHEDVISRILEIQPININSNLVSAQNRERLYWTNIAMAQRGLFGDNYCTIPQPKDKGIFLRDILQQEVDEKYYLSDKALARINRKTYSQPKINPDKSGTINTKNNSGQLSVDSGTTLIISDRGPQGQYIVTENKTGALSAHDGCGWDHYIVENKGVLNDNGTLVDCEKANCIDANYFKGMDNHSQRTMIVHTLEPINVSKDNLILQRMRGDNPGGERAVDGKVPCLSSNSWEHNNHLMEIRQVIQLNESKESGGVQPYQQNRVYDINGIAPALSAELGGERTHLIKVPQTERVYDTDDKSVTIGARQGGMGAGTGLYNIQERIRRLTPIEVCRLQTVPDDYFFHEGKQIVSDSQIYKMIGNGWTIDAIVHILSHIKFE